MPRDQARAIARAFLPARRWGSRYDYHYVQAKLRTDPLYAGVLATLRGTPWPVLDLGCGLGLLAHALRAGEQAQGYLGVDIDAAKIARATRAAQVAGLHDVRFTALDLAEALPAHAGSVALLDVLQYLPATRQQALLAEAATRLAPDAPLVIRTPLAGDHPRGRFTRIADRLGHLSGWMRTSPRDYPSREGLLATLASLGLQGECSPLYGNTPFNNWLVVARRQ
ncbi:methyltransferase [Stenotrophomonas panacihumi]|uniref:Methyltransferase n=1 Tax=Stenotrophomonas panacihumi TaxID=676599 RepID=A0A0R0AC00_9GAMM|nr:class I SAM-dependent methyltransferase [Stenotrophomonas panacihumi]KRG42317.1 methyltransferase [Stenotrophomonas panacihumi]PTN53626.1 SAM-dependent methyltransferase [Stenotrophomonas panacihumi]